jgi:hypothetical protein
VNRWSASAAAKWLEFAAGVGENGFDGKGENGLGEAKELRRR